jgi:hypothetical protein
MAFRLMREDGLPSLWILLAVASFLAYTVGTVVYRLYFHPLAKFPGPRLAAATHWYESYHDLVHKGGAQFAAQVREMHIQYGPIVRINPDEISVNDAQFHDKLFAPQPAVRDRHPNFSSALGTTKGSFSTPDHFLHKNRRVAYSPFFASVNVTASESMVLEKLNHLCELLAACKEDTPPLRTYFAAISFDSFYTMAFGSSLNLLDDLPLAENCNNTVELLVTTAPFYRIFPSVMAFARAVPHSLLRRLSSHVARVFDLHAVSRL